MDPQEKERQQRLVVEACRHPLGSRQRQRYLTQLIREVSPSLWRESTPYYGDALQQTWEYFCKHLCDRYDATRASIATWLNNHLRWRLTDLRNLAYEEAKREYRPRPNADGVELDPVAQIPAPDYTPPLLELVRTWAETDEDGDLRNTHVRGFPQVNCQMLILRRLPPETGWKELSREFNQPVATLSTFYQRKCVPRLHNFGQSAGYL
jgi:hypothetical protein